MDQNLTYPIVLNASIYIPAAENPIKELLPSILAIIVVLIGASATYFYAIKLEERKKKYDLKINICFELLDLLNNYLINIHDATRVKQDMIPINDEEIPKEIKGNPKLLEEELNKRYSERSILEKMIEIDKSLITLFPKLQVVCSKETCEIALAFGVYIRKYQVKNDINEIANMQQNLINAIRKELDIKDFDKKTNDKN